jgi:hypothetical protein
VLLQDSDQMTRINAAIGLARHDSTAGWSAFQDVLADAVANPIVPPAAPTEEQAQTYFERTLILTNCLKAVERLQAQLGPEERDRTSRLLDQVAAATADDKLSLTARELALQLRANRPE